VRDSKERTIRTFERAIAYYYFKDVVQARNLFSQCIEECPDDALAKVYLGKCDRFLETGFHEGTGEVDLVVRWTPDIAVGHPDIDEQHRELFAAVQKFAEKVKNDRDFSHAGPLLGFLDEYIQVHFDTEEGIMEYFGYPFLDVEKEQHEAFNRKFIKLKNEIDSNADIYFLLFKIQVLVIDWLVHHTGKLDRHFGKFLTFKEPAEERYDR
jgi:hemerythrin